MSVRVRIAPSPTGDPHVGTAYVALYNFVFARQHGGQFILRIEDTDQTRARSTSEAQIMDSLKWLGLDWDEGPDGKGERGPYRQSERQAIYREHVARLVESGHAYPCFCTPERLAQVRTDQRAAGLPTKYDGRCRGLPPEEAAQRIRNGETHVIRLKMPQDGITSFQDELRGAVDINNQQIDDQVLLKSDGFPTYHLANVVDDHLMGITHVIRAEEWISSTPKHVQLYKSFGWPEPKWVHLPLLRNSDKSKISKRKNPVSLSYYRRAGILPQALLNFLALMGWNPGGDVELFSLDDMIEAFDIKKVNLGGPVFDIVKLNWMNQQYLQKMSTNEFVKTLRCDFFSEDYLARIQPLVSERLQRFDEFVSKNSFFFSGSLDYADVPIVPKGKEKAEVRKAMKALVEILDDLYEWNADTLQDTIDRFKDELGWKPKDVFMPLRLICCGRKDSPPLAPTLEVLGREMVRFRLRDAIRTVLK